MTYPGDLLAHLRSFTVLADAIERRERGPFVRAARELAVDTSVLRRRISTLSEHLGAPLLAGRGSRARLTPTGQEARTRASRALDAVAEVDALAGDEDGPLRVACTGTVLAEVLPSVLRTMRREWPALRFRVRRAGASAARELLEHGEVDFAVIRSDEPPGDSAKRRIGQDRLWLAVPASHRATAGRPLREHAQGPLIGYGTASSTMRRVMAVMGPLGARPFIEVDGKAAALAYVAAGLGIAFVSALDSQVPTHRGVAMTDVSRSFAPVAFWLLWPAEGRRRAWQERFIQLIAPRRAG